MALFKFLPLVFIFDFVFATTIIIQNDDVAVARPNDYSINDNDEIINRVASLLIPVLIPCRYDDSICYERSMKLFLQRTSLGIPEYDIRAIDPFIVPELTFRSADVTLRFTNIHVNGMKNRKYMYYNVNPRTQTYTGIVREHPYVTADLSIQLSNSGNTHSGKYTAATSAITTVTFDFDKRGDKTVIGPETIRVELATRPKITLCSKLTELLGYGLAGQTLLEEKYVEDIGKKLTVELIEAIHVRIMHNLRQVLSVLPTTALFSDI